MSDHYLGLRQATAIRPDRLIVAAGDSRLDGSTLSALADAGAVSAVAAAALPLERPPGVCL